MITYFGKFFKKPSKNNITFVSLQLGQLIVFKGMLIGIYKSPDLFNKKQFGVVFSRNFTQSQIQQKIADKDYKANDDLRRFHFNNKNYYYYYAADLGRFHTAITY